MTRARRIVLGLALVGALGIAGCGKPADETTPAASGGLGSGSASSGACTKDSLATLAKGTLTVGTDDPAYPPWFVDNTPGNGKGYESAVAYAIGEKLGFAKGEVRWAKVPFNSAVSPGKKTFDLDLNQVSISDERTKAVDFSSGYYDVRQAVVTYKGSPIAGAKDVAGLAKAKLGAQVGTTSYTAIANQIKPSDKPSVFDTNDLAVQALKNKQIDGIVVDLPTAFYMTGAQLEGGVIVGQLPAAGATPEQFGAVLDKGSPLTACVTKAVDELRADGTLKRLADQWLAKQGAPELR